MQETTLETCFKDEYLDGNERTPEERQLRDKLLAL